MTTLLDLYRAVDASKDGMIRLARELVRIPSENPPGAEERVAHVLAERLAAWGFRTQVVAREPSRPNVVARVTGSSDISRAILFNGHLDVFPVPTKEGWDCDPWGALIKGGRLYGRGACDMKGGIAAYCWAAKVLKDSGIPMPGEVVLTAVSDENMGGPLGTQYLLEQGLQAAMAVVAEPTHLDVVTACRGAVWFEITAHGRAAHTGAPGINAITKMIPVIARIQELDRRLRAKTHPLAGAEEAGVHVIRGGEVVNQIPARCTIEIDRRLVPGSSLEEAINELMALCRQAEQEDPETTLSTRIMNQAPPAEIPATEAVVRLAQEAGERVWGQRPQVRGLFGFTDSRLLIHQGGIPTIVCGPGALENAHGDNEFVEVVDLVRAAKLYITMMARMACDLAD